MTLEPRRPDPLPARDQLRLVTAGSVDDGKSTLVGRLLHDTKSILADQFEAIEAGQPRPRPTDLDLALLTDGLRAEREQGITIDVAYRYFATARRNFILADYPGHVQYTRNTVTGSSTADVLVLLVDVRKGVLDRPGATSRSSRCCGCRTWWSRSTRSTWSTSTRGATRRWPTRSPSSPPGSACREPPPCRSRRCRATTSSTARSARRGTTARACSGCWRNSSPARPTRPRVPVRRPAHPAAAVRRDRPRLRRVPRLRRAGLGRAGRGR